MSGAEPTVAVDALETFVELLAGADVDSQTDDFYSRLCEATCRVASMDRAIIFRYDDALYVLTSNRDGRGSPEEGDDRVLRVTAMGS